MESTDKRWDIFSKKWRTLPVMLQESNDVHDHATQGDVHVLVIRFSSIGDIVLCTPVFRLLKKHLYGRIHVHFLTKKKYAPLVAGNPNVDHIHPIVDDVREAFRVLEEVPFDYVIDLHNNLRSSRVKQHLRVAAFTVNKQNLRKWMMVHLKRGAPVPHIVTRYIDTLRAFGIDDDGEGLDFHLADEDETASLRLPESHRNGYIAFALGGTYPTKRLPPKHIAKICDHLKYPVVLVGGQDDAGVAQYVKLHTRAVVYDGCGQMDLIGSASLICHAKAVITHDTGMMHIGAAFGRPLVVIWGNTTPNFGMSPRMRRRDPEPVFFQVDGLRCRPCSKLGKKNCPRKHFHCMERMDPIDVAEAANAAAERVSPRRLP